MIMGIREVLMFSIAQRQAMHAYRQSHLRLSRNAIEVMLYAMAKGNFTAYEVSEHFLHTNIHQTLVVLNQLVEHNILFRAGKGIKGKPMRFFLTETGTKEANNYLNLSLNTVDSFAVSP